MAIVVRQWAARERTASTTGCYTGPGVRQYMRNCRSQSPQARVPRSPCSACAAMATQRGRPMKSTSSRSRATRSSFSLSPMR